MNLLPARILNPNLLWFLVLCLGATAAWAEPIPIANVQRAEPVDFGKDILPILQRNCLACHSASERQGELVLESPDAMRKGGDSGPSILPGRGAESLLLKLAAHQDEPVMPPADNDVNAKPLTPEELGLLRLWIDQGARGGELAKMLSPGAWLPLPAGVGPVNAVSLTVDGQYVAATRANRLYLYHVPTGRLVTELSDPALASLLPPNASAVPPAHRDLIETLAINLDGDLLASGGFREIKLWRRPRDVQLARFDVGGAVTAVATSADQQWIAAAAADNQIRLWKTASNEPGPVLTGHEDQVTDLRFSPDGARLVSSSRDQTIRLWKVTDGAPAGVIHTPAIVNALEWVASAAANPEQPPPLTLVSGGEDNFIRTWSVPEQAPTRFESMLANLDQAIVSPDGRFLAAGNPEGIVRVIRRQPAAAGKPATIQPVAEWKLEAGPPTALAFVASNPPASGDSPDGPPPHLATAAKDGSIRLWHLPDHQLITTWIGGPAPTTAFAASADGRLLASGMETGAIALWDLPADVAQLPSGAEAMPARVIEGISQPITALRFHSNGQTLFATARDGSFRGFTTANGQQTFATSHGAAIHDLALSPNEQVLATAGENGQVRLWQTNGGGFGPQQLTGFPGPVRSVAFSADGTKVIAGSAGDKPVALVFDLQTGAQQQRFVSHAQPILRLASVGNAASPSELAALVSISPDAAWQWTVHGVRQVPGHGGPVTALAAIPNTPQQVFSGSRDTTIRRWNLDNGQQMAQYNHGGAVLGVAVRGDAQRLASASDNHTAKLWNINGQQIAEMRGDVRRKTLVARLTQQQNAANQRLNLSKQRLDSAEKDVPAKTEAEKKAAESLAATNKDVQEKMAALQKAEGEKIAAEKAAIEASRAARQALLAKTDAEDAAKRAAAEVPIAQQRATQIAAAANAAPNDQNLNNAVAAAQQAVTAAQQKAQQLQQAVAAPTQAAQTKVNEANTAAQKVTEAQKPFNDALAALRTAESAQNLAAQQHVLAARELQVAQANLPIAKEAMTVAEATVAEVKQQLDAANQESAAADLALRGICFSNQGNLLATAGEFPSVHLWDAENGSAVAALAGHEGPLTAVAFLDDQRIVSGSDDGTVRVWELNPQWRLERTIGAVDQPDVISHRVTSLDFNADATRLLVGGGVPSRNGELHIFQVADGARTLFLPQAHDDVVQSARFSPDGKRIASAGADKYLRTWDIASGQPLRRFEGHTNYVLGVAWKGDGQTLVSAAADNSIKVWDAETADQQRTIPNFGKHVTAVRYIGETDNIVSSCGDRLIRMHNAANGGNFRNFGGPGAWLHCVDVTPDSNVVATGDAQGKLYLWNGNNGQQLRTIEVGQVTP